MSGESENFDEDSDNPFDIFASLGLRLVEQEEGDDDEEEQDSEADWDDDVYWANFLIYENSLGDWGLFVDGLEWDGSRDLSELSYVDEIAFLEHAHFAFQSLRAERHRSQTS